ncbi:myosin-9 [Anaeramoeba flamelloides]|uniref:Myosin-9 n=1 Tax=Anaeramoeba flamelloides TaxID=1746091 RepID=A0ABQ8ZCF0_9EUKA|nr:myosin-9 [Anaeramoeba flamelloides]
MFKKKIKCRLQFGIILLSRVRQKNKTVFVKWKRGKSQGETKKALLDKCGCAEWNQEFSIKCSLFQDKKTKEFAQKILRLSIYFDIEKTKTKRSLRRGNSEKRIATLQINVAKGFSIKNTQKNKVQPILKEYPLNLRNTSSHFKVPKILVAYKIQMNQKSNKSKRKKIPKLLNETYLLQRLEEYEIMKRNPLKSITQTEEYTEITGKTELMTDTEDFEDQNSENWNEEIDEWEILEKNVNSKRRQLQSNVNNNENKGENENDNRYEKEIENETIYEEINISVRKINYITDITGSVSYSGSGSKSENNYDNDSGKDNSSTRHIISDSGYSSESNSEGSSDNRSEPLNNILSESENVSKISLNDFLSPPQKRKSIQKKDQNKNQEKRKENSLKNASSVPKLSENKFKNVLSHQNSAPLNKNRSKTKKVSKLNEISDIQQNWGNKNGKSKTRTKSKANQNVIVKKEKQNPKILFKKSEYQKILKLENWLIERIFLFSNSLYSNGYPISACMVFKCFLYWKAFEPTFDQESESESKSESKTKTNLKKKIQNNLEINDKKSKQEDDILSAFLNSLNSYLETNENEQEMLYWLFSNVNFLIKLIQKYFSLELENEYKNKKKRKKSKQEQYFVKLRNSKKKINDGDGDDDNDNDNDNTINDGDDDNCLRKETKNYKIYKFQKKIKKLLLRILELITNNILSEIKPNIINAFLDNTSNSSLNFGKVTQKKSKKKSKKAIAFKKILIRLDKFNEELKDNYFPIQLKQIFFNQIIYLIDAELTNDLFKFEQYCQCGNGFQIKLAVSQFEERLSKLNIKNLHNFTKIKQASECLAMNKVIINNKKDKYNAISDISPDLNYIQVLRLLKNFQIDEFDNLEIPQEKIVLFENFIKKKLKKNSKTNNKNDDDNHFENNLNIDLNYIIPYKIDYSKIECDGWEKINKPMILKSKKQFNFLDKDLDELLND